MSESETDPFSLSGRRILITGGAGEIGMAIARQARARGARIALYDLKPPSVGGEVVEEEFAFVRGSVDAVEEVQAGFDRLSGKLGGLDGLVTSAGRFSARPIGETSLEDWRADMAVNLDGVFLSVRHALPMMADGGSIVFLSSVTGHNGSIISPAYAAGKAALLGLARSLVSELRPRNIRINCVSPGPVDTAFAEPFRTSPVAATLPPQTPASPADVANAVLFLLARASAHVNGESLILTGGHSFA